MIEESASFTVTGHFELHARGGFVIGHITDGIMRNGMHLRSEMTGQAFTICGIEFLDNTAKRESFNALVFSEKPTLAQVQQAFPVGVVAIAS